MGNTSKVLVTTAVISAVLIAFAVWVLSGITVLDAFGVVAISLLISLALRHLREKHVKLRADDEGQRHHRGRGGGGLM
ncbi:hypothetical protein GCM10027404_29010 [Arthrobacter tumbae]|uniref:hypothetical protein n=1 Tax=Arthrobacter tumbae TaxID=163874 RepID=UPI00195B4943|nr:hypothetical protein [Arthrobacter tumbae]MBM7782957.1 Flp pilus assembly protein TadB [Arthrobacter tumbae]